MRAARVYIGARPPGSEWDFYGHTVGFLRILLVDDVYINFFTCIKSVDPSTVCSRPATQNCCQHSAAIQRRSKKTFRERSVYYKIFAVCLPVHIKLQSLTCCDSCSCAIQLREKFGRVEDELAPESSGHWPVQISKRIQDSGRYA